MEDYLKLLLSFLGKLHNKTEEEIATLIMDGDVKEGKLKTDALNVLTSLEEKRVKSLKKADPKDLTAAEKKGHDAALAEALQHVKETFGFESDSTGLDFYTELKAAVSTGDAGSKTVTEEDIKKSKAYRDLKSAHGDEIKTINKTWQEKIDKRESEIKQKEAMSVVNKSALKYFNEMKPVLPEDADKAARHTKLLLLDLLAQGYEYEVENAGTEQEKIIPKKDGKPLEDSLGHIIDFKAHVQGIAKQNFTFAKADEKDSGGDPTKPGKVDEKANGHSAKFKSYKLTKPKDADEWMKRHGEIEGDKELTPEEKADLTIQLKNLHKAEVKA